METKNGYKMRQFNEETLAGAFKTMFKNMKSGKTIYLAFSKRNFHILVFVLGMNIVANSVLIDLLINAPTMVQRMDMPFFITQFSLSSAAVVSGFWLFLRGINIITDK